MSYEQWHKQFMVNGHGLHLSSSSAQVGKYVSRITQFYSKLSPTNLWFLLVVVGLGHPKLSY